MTGPTGEHGGAECREMFAKLSEYLDGELDPAACRCFEEHLHGCEPCQAFLESLRRTVAHVARVPRPRLPDDLEREVVAAFERARREGRR